MDIAIIYQLYGNRVGLNYIIIIVFKPKWLQSCLISHFFVYIFATMNTRNKELRMQTILYVLGDLVWPEIEFNVQHRRPLDNFCTCPALPCPSPPPQKKNMAKCKKKISIFNIKAISMNLCTWWFFVRQDLKQKMNKLIFKQNILGKNVLPRKWNNN